MAFSAANPTITELSAYSVSPSFGIIPPTPDDLLPTHDFASPIQYASISQLPYQQSLLTSPPPIETGIICQSQGVNDRSTPCQNLVFSRSSGSPSFLRPKPYDRGARHSGTSISSRADSIGSVTASEWQWESGAEDSGGSRTHSREPSPGISLGCIDRAALLSLCPEEQPNPETADTTTTDPWSVKTPVQASALPGHQAYRQPEIVGQDQSNAGGASHLVIHPHDASASIAQTKGKRAIHRVNTAPPHVTKKSAATPRKASPNQEKQLYVTPLTRSGKKSHARKVRLVVPVKQSKGN
jgi:hypothetical protein